MAGIDFKELARLLTCKEFAEAEGLEMHGGRARCPFHGGEHFNLAFLRDGHCHCYVCGRTADSVQLASAVWRMNQRDAAVELNERFKLGLQAEAVNAAELERRRRDREAARQAEAEAQAAEDAEYMAAADELRAAEAAVAKLNATDWTPALTAAVKRLAAAQEQWSYLWANMKAPVIRNRGGSVPTTRQAAEDAVKEAEAEAQVARATLENTSTTSANYAEALRQVRNANTWLNFKRIELRNLERGRL